MDLLNTDMTDSLLVNKEANKAARLEAAEAKAADHEDHEGYASGSKRRKTTAKAKAQPKATPMPAGDRARREVIVAARDGPLTWNNDHIAAVDHARQEV